jgi:prepilin-type N-terminal cleavage/methylation domain-containing protein
MNRSPKRGDSPLGPWIFRHEAFTVLELLVVISVMCVLASLLFPALQHATTKAQGMVCLGNVRQLTLGWLMYSDDQQGWLCPNGPGPRQGWVEGVLNFEVNVTDNTNTLYLTDPAYAKLAAYVKSPGVYHCPADKSLADINHALYPRVRSLAMNDAVGSNAQGPSPSPEAGWKVYHKMNDITAPVPSLLWVLIEQHPDSIDDGGFAVDCASQGYAARWIDFPANFHNLASSLAFADGHAEMRQWLAAGSAPPNRYCGCLAHYAARGVYTSSPYNADIAWLQARTSSQRN